MSVLTDMLRDNQRNVRYNGHMEPIILNPRDLGLALRAERKALGKTQAELAQAVPCKRQTIVDLEAGRNVSLHTLMAVLAALGKGLSILDARASPERLRQLLDPADEG